MVTTAKMEIVGYYCPGARPGASEAPKDVAEDEQPCEHSGAD